MDDLSPKIYSALKRHRLDPSHYTLALLREAYRLGLVSQETVDGVQGQVVTLLGETVLKYTQGDSSSVKVETAQRLLGSIYYAIDAVSRSFADPEDALAILTAGQVKDLYQNGLVLIEECVAECRRLYNDVVQNKLDVPNVAYHSTIDSLPLFFRHYDMRFNAQDTMADMDYPLLFDNMRIEGCYYIKQYLEKLILETSFCRLFDLQDINKLLRQYGRVYGIDYKEDLINIFEIVLTNAIFSVLSGHRAARLIISEHQFHTILSRLECADQNQVSTMLSGAMETLMASLRITDPDLQNIIWRFHSVLMPRLISALENSNLNNVVIVDTLESPSNELVYDAGRRMEDKRFRNLVAEIMLCSETNRKIAIINKEIHALEDFIDMLEAECLFEDEFDALYRTLGDVEISLLARWVFAEELRLNPTGFVFAAQAEKRLDAEWQSALSRFISSLDPDRREAIEVWLQADLATGSLS